LSAFHSFGLSSELASTLSPSLFQFAFTAHSTFVRHAIHTTIPRILLGLNLMWDLKVRQHRAPILFFFGRKYPRSRQACSTRFWSNYRPRRCAKSVLVAPETSSHMSITKRTLLRSANFFAKFQRVQVFERSKVLRISERGTECRHPTHTGSRANRPQREARRRTSARPQPTARHSRRECGEHATTFDRPSSGTPRIDRA